MESGIRSYHLYRFLEILSLHGNGVSLLGFTSKILGEVLIPTMIYFEPGSQVSMDPLILTEGMKCNALEKWTNFEDYVVGLY